jgi:hypothetical protein
MHPLYMYVLVSKIIINVGQLLFFKKFTRCVIFLGHIGYQYQNFFWVGYKKLGNK